jgi:hypothetical protein
MSFKNQIRLITFFAVAFLFTHPTFSQTQQKEELWRTFEPLIGDWTGEGGGEPGQGRYERSYKFIFERKYIEVRNRSVYPASKDFPGGEVHEDLGYISYDKLRKVCVLRQFHKEGFVNQYKLDSLSAEGKNFVFISEAIENIKPGWMAKESYRLFSDTEFSETFSLAAPGKEFEVYSKVVLKRKTDNSAK